MSTVLSYENSFLYSSDLPLLDDGGWLNDNLITYHFNRLIADPSFSAYPPSAEHERDASAIFLDPAVVSFLMFQLDANDEDERNDFVTGTLEGKAEVRLIIPISSEYVPGNTLRVGAGAHWSLLALSISNGTISAIHADSSSNTNLAQATAVTNKISLLLNSSPPTPTQATVPQQTNSYDCGVYTLFFAEFFATNRSNSSIVPLITPAAITAFRKTLLDDIKQQIQQKK